MELLGEFGDTELKFGCMVKLRQWYSKVVSVSDRFFKTYWNSSFWSYNKERFIKEKIIWQYHLWSILNLFEIIEAEWRCKIRYFNWSIIIEEKVFNIWDEYYLRLWKSKPPMERSDEQKQELIDFMKEVLRYNK